MIRFDVNDMTCGHCVASITRAVRAVDPAATVDADLARHQVTIALGTSTPAAVQAAIEDAGFTPVPLPDAGPAAPAP